MAEKVAVGYLPGTDPESVQANMAYQQALQKMQSALEARQNRFFDPEMLAFAQGMLAPTQTGGFGESLGYSLKGLREAQAQAEKEEQDIASAQLGLAGKGLELERLKQREREFGRLMGEPIVPSAPQSGGALTAPSAPGLPSAPGALPTAQRQGALSMVAPPKGFEGVQGIPTMPANPTFMTGRQYLGMARLDPSISPTTAIKDAQKMDQERFQTKESGVQDLATGIFYPFPKGEQVTRQIFGQEGEFKVDAKTAALLDMYAANGDPRYYEVADKVIKGPKAPSKPGEKPAGEEKPEEPGKILSVGEMEAKAAGAKESAQQRAKAQEAERSKTIDAGSDAPSRIGSYNQLQKIAGSKEAPLIFGIFERSGFWPQFGKLIETGVGVPGFTIGIPAIREVMTNAGIPQQLIDQSQFAMSLVANVALQISRLSSGQGQVSNYERDLFGQAGVTMKDNPQTILAKLDMLRARAEFDREVAAAVRKYKGNIDDFKGGNDYQRMVQEYEAKLGSIVENRLSGTKPAPQPTGRDNQGAASRLPAEVR